MCIPFYNSALNARKALAAPADVIKYAPLARNSAVLVKSMEEDFVPNTAAATAVKVLLPKDF